MQKVVVLNPKGGSGKTTIATNLAAYYATQAKAVCLIDFDPQASSTRWVAARDPERATVELTRAFERQAGVTRSWQLHRYDQAEYVVVDTPAGMDVDTLKDVTRDASAILIPVLPSEIDIHAASRCIGDLLLSAKIKPQDGRIAVIANRSRKKTRTYQALHRFLSQLNIPFLTALRDAQVYVQAAGDGCGIFELPRYRTKKDLESWQPIFEWLDSRAANVAGYAGVAPGQAGSSD